MATIVLKGFSGEIPRLAPKDLAGNQSQYAKNCKLYSGKIMPWKESVDVLNLGAMAAAPVTIYLFNEFWIWWTSEVNVVRSPIVDVDDRTYFTGTDFPRVFDSTMILGSTAGTLLTSYRTGVPAPASAPVLVAQSVKKVDTSTSRGSIGCNSFAQVTFGCSRALEEVEVETEEGVQSRVYVFTYVNSWGEEGPTSPASEIIDIDVGLYRTVEINGSWTVAPLVPTEYFYGGDDLTEEPSSVKIDEVTYSRGDVGDLEKGQWGWSGNLLYVRLLQSDPDPNNLDDDLVVVGWVKYVDVNEMAETYLADTADPDSEASIHAEYHIEKKRIYRVNLGSSAPAYQYVGEVDIGTLSYRDRILNADLKEVITTSTFYPPPSDMKGLTAIPGNFLAGFHENEVCFSEPNKCYAWPPGYRQSVHYPVVALGVYGNTVIVETTEEIYLMTGTHPASMVMDDNSIKKACLSSRGNVITENGTFFPTVEGMLFIGAGGVRVVTADIMKMNEWKARQPATMHAYFYNGDIVCFHRVDWSEAYYALVEAIKQENIEYYYGDEYLAGSFGTHSFGTRTFGGSKLKSTRIPYDLESGEGFVLGSGLSEGTIVRLDYAFCGFMDHSSGYLYVVRKNGDDEYVIRQLDASAENTIATWTSKLFQMQFLINFGAAKVVADFGTPLSDARKSAYNAYRDSVIAANQALIDAGVGSGAVDTFEIDALEIHGGGLAEVPAEIPDDPSVLFRLFINQAVVFEKQVFDAEPFRLPSGYRERVLHVQVLTNIDIDEVRLATSITELSGGAD